MNTQAEILAWVRENMHWNRGSDTSDVPEFYSDDDEYAVNRLLDTVAPQWREALGPPPEPLVEVTLRVKVNTRHGYTIEYWFYECPIHGKSQQFGGSDDLEILRRAHDDAIRAAVLHEQEEHGGNGIVPVHMLLDP